MRSPRSVARVIAARSAEPAPSAPTSDSNATSCRLPSRSSTKRGDVVRRNRRPPGRDRNAACAPARSAMSSRIRLSSPRWTDQITSLSSRAVSLQVGAAVEEMHHAAAHHHRLRHHLVVGAGEAQRVAAAFGQREVDRAAAAVALHARVAALLEDLHLPAALREQGGEQAPARPAPTMVMRAIAARSVMAPASRHGFDRAHEAQHVGVACCRAARARCGSRRARASRRARRLRARYSNRARPRSRPPITRSDSWQPRRSGSARRHDLQRVGQARVGSALRGSR